MKHNTILPSVFPLCGFHHYSLDELLDRQEKYGDRIDHMTSLRGVAHSKYLGYFDDVIPSFSFRNKIYSVDLICIETDPEDSGLFLNDEDKDANSAIAAVFITEPGVSEVVAPKDLLLRFNDGKAGHFRFILGVILDSSYSGLNFEKADENQKEVVKNNLVSRKMLFAKEFTTAYRDFIELWMFLSGDNPEYTGLSDHFGDGVSAKNSCHPSDEGAWRLICDFRTISNVLNKFSIYPEFRHLKCATDYLRFKDEHPTLYKIYLNHWFEHERVNPQVAEKKTLEYFMHKSL